MPYMKLDDINPALKGIEPPITLAQANMIAEWADAITGVDSPWAVAIANFKKAYEVRGDKWVKKVAEQGVDMCVCPECGYEMEHERGVPCSRTECPECGATMGPEVEESMSKLEKWIDALENAERIEDDPECYVQMSDTLVSELVQDLREMQQASLRELLEQALAMLDDNQDEGMAEFTESASGHVIGLVEAELMGEGNRAPVEFDLKIIAPGAGNKRDKHWYPADMLRRDAHVFEGVDMFVTDHREDERSERTKVGKIKSIVGFADDGGPIGRAVIYDPELAEKTRNRAIAGELETLHCSILASGTAKPGKIDGQKYHIVEAINHAEAVDLVSRAGAGGRALALAESQEEPMENETDVADIIEESEEATFSEQDNPPAEDLLAPERVQEMVKATRLPKAARERLSEAEYADEAAVQEAIDAEVAYIKEVTGSGKPFAQGAGDPPPEKKPRTAEEADAYFKRVLTEVGMPHLAGG